MIFLARASLKTLAVSIKMAPAYALYLLFPKKYRRWYFDEFFSRNRKVEVDQVRPTSTKTVPCSFTLTKKLAFLLRDSLTWICQSAIRVIRATIAICTMTIMAGCNCLMTKQAITEEHAALSFLEEAENQAWMVSVTNVTIFFGHLGNISSLDCNEI